jgi:GT2 family glycosyltransferase
MKAAGESVRLRAGLLATVSRALARHGWRGLAARLAETLRAGGPVLVLHRVRHRQYLERATPSPGGVAPHPAPAALVAGARTASGSDEAACDLGPDHGLPVAQFDSFMNGWAGHPAIRDVLIEGRAAPFAYSVVVSPHGTHGFAGLADTVAFAGYLARRADIAVRVIVYEPLDQATPAAPAAGLPGRGLAICRARSVAEIRHLLSPARPRHLVQFVVSGDRICPVFAEIVARSRIPDFDLVLADMYFHEPEQTVHPVFLPGLNMIHALNVDYFLSRSIIEASLAVEELGALSRLDVHALTTAALARCSGPGARKAHHLAFPVLRIAETRAAILERRVAATSRSTPLRLTLARRPDPAARPARRVSVVICTRNNGFLLEQLVTALWSGDGRDHLADVVVVANGTADPHAVQVQRELATAGRARVMGYDRPFNFSAQSNLGAAAAAGDVLLFLNDDIVPVNGSWLAELVAPLDEPEIGVVGPLLLYPDQSVQHAGMFLGFNDIAGHTLRGARLPHGDYCFMASAPRRVMAVTGAALAMRRQDFEALNGFDQNQFALHAQDVDLCLRAHFSGLAVMYNPRAVLLHMESASVRACLADPRFADRRGREHAAFLKRWGHVLAADEFHNPNFSRGAESLRCLALPVG